VVRLRAPGGDEEVEVIEIVGQAAPEPAPPDPRG
jgi:hypothetical protein